MKSILILNAQLINEGTIKKTDVFIQNARIQKIAPDLSTTKADSVIDGTGKYLMAGVIDDQVHFREPGLTHKADIYHEAKAAVAGGTTSFMEMPNTKPQSLTQELLEQKYQTAAKTSLANYSFFMGVSNDNIAEVLKTDSQKVCGLKIFMGSSTGDMLVDDRQVLENIFSQTNMLIATHCEDEETVRKNTAIFREKYGEQMSIERHPEIRNVEACLKSSSLAVELAKKHNTRLHILHISTAEELALFDNALPLKDKRITAEVCVHHLWFDKEDYQKMGTKIKCNPAIKEKRHKKALFEALLDNRLDIIATDHAPHTQEEKNNNYWNAPSGLPLVQHSLQAILEFYHQGKISLERIAEKMAHAPAICFQVEQRGFVREGYWADLVLFDLEKSEKVEKNNLHYKCEWSPFEGQVFNSSITHTIVSGHLAYQNGVFDEQTKGKRLNFNR